MCPEHADDDVGGIQHLPIDDRLRFGTGGRVRVCSPRRDGDEDTEADTVFVVPCVDKLAHDRLLIGNISCSCEE